MITDHESIIRFAKFNMADHLTKISEIEVTKNTAVLRKNYEIKRIFGDFL